ncbi:CDP-glucose 4,6-dehydratase [Formosa agariphila KMM 3901]|uniref:CDP-glucose 4,6-dehydratase n=1 Tax=Formosa agariphila (strain DSM 15362 / KCTC 12365 / LMG 23005 / KMM 3901 / M-2Alg 35-1) TaxID=1347342 RepID=T2KNG6_FORAG|nr:CDP-glucose 4,6-dehydratase [Formosa agariphila]CDF80008.1 CDP-glucose 4,6-dehydratase [Formosa agariphila KMM 3901]
MENVVAYDGFFKGKKVFLTGHTGFKGSWMTLLLQSLGADVTGYALSPDQKQNLFDYTGLDKKMNSHIGNVKDFSVLQDAMIKANPDIVIHMAAQPLVIESYKNPINTYETNVMGTVNVLEAVRQLPNVDVCLNITTDKVYKNNEWLWGYRETDTLGGHDPYSNSKACSEFVTQSYRDSFFTKSNTLIATARAGNVIGGGDWAENRLVPDFIKAIQAGEEVIIRSPKAVRPWQHVLDCLGGYLHLIWQLSSNRELATSYNFGPENDNIRTVESLISKVCKSWGETASYKIEGNDTFHEAGLLRLDISRARQELGWEPKWGMEKTVSQIVSWYKAFSEGEDALELCNTQIDEFLLQ